MHWKYGLEIIGDILVIVFALFLGFHFIAWISGDTYWGEPDKWILSFEIAMTAAILIIGGINLYRDIK